MNQRDVSPRDYTVEHDCADHSFHMLKSSGKTDAAVLQEIARTVSLWTQALGRVNI
jgi:hypothetical protein